MGGEARRAVGENELAEAVVCISARTRFLPTRREVGEILQDRVWLFGDAVGYVGGKCSRRRKWWWCCCFRWEVRW